MRSYNLAILAKYTAGLGWTNSSSFLPNSCDTRSNLKSCNLASWTTKWHDYATGTTQPPP